MFRRKTVFVLGAGASWHYAYPTGESLVQRAAEVAERLRAYCGKRANDEFAVTHLPEFVTSRVASLGKSHVTPADTVQVWRETEREYATLAERLLSVRPLVIDYFLGLNARLQEAGRLSIAIAILEAEAGHLKLHQNTNRLAEKRGIPDDWYRFVVHKLVIGCETADDLLKRNGVHFVTFNYDTSLEYHLRRSLLGIDLVAPAAGDFLADDRILHVCAAVRSGACEAKDAINLEATEGLTRHSSRTLLNTTQVIDKCFRASAGLKTIDPYDKHQDAVLKRAQQVIEQAEVVYILGYGFDENNNSRIGLDPLLTWHERKNKRIMFTNFEDRNTINKRASNLFFGIHDKFLGQWLHEKSNGDWYVEKSTNDVYRALEQDFDALESR